MFFKLLNISVNSNYSTIPNHLQQSQHIQQNQSQSLHYQQQWQQRIAQNSGDDKKLDISSSQHNKNNHKLADSSQDQLYSPCEGPSPIQSNFSPNKQPTHQRHDNYLEKVKKENQVLHERLREIDSVLEKRSFDDFHSKQMAIKNRLQKFHVDSSTNQVKIKCSDYIEKFGSSQGSKKPSKSAEPRERIRKVYDIKPKELPRSFYTEIIDEEEQYKSQKQQQQQSEQQGYQQNEQFVDQEAHQKYLKYKWEQVTNKSKTNQQQRDNTSTPSDSNKIFQFNNFQRKQKTPISSTRTPSTIPSTRTTTATEHFQKATLDPPRKRIISLSKQSDLIKQDPRSLSAGRQQRIDKQYNQSNLFSLTSHVPAGSTQQTTTVSSNRTKVILPIHGNGSNKTNNYDGVNLQQNNFFSLYKANFDKTSPYSSKSTHIRRKTDSTLPDSLLADLSKELISQKNQIDSIESKNTSNVIIRQPKQQYNHDKGSYRNGRNSDFLLKVKENEPKQLDMKNNINDSKNYNKQNAVRSNEFVVKQNGVLNGKINNNTIKDIKINKTNLYGKYSISQEKQSQNQNYLQKNSKEEIRAKTSLERNEETTGIVKEEIEEDEPNKHHDAEVLSILQQSF